MMNDLIKWMRRGKHRSVSSFLRYTFILKFPWQVCFTLRPCKCTSFLDVKIVPGRLWRAAKKKTMRV